MCAGMTLGYLGLLPLLLSAVLLFLLVTRLSSRFRLPPRRFLPFFLSAVSFATLAVILTETLSAFSALSRQGLSNAWWASACVLALLNLLLSRMFTRCPASPIVRENSLRSHSPSPPRGRLQARVASALRGVVSNDRFSSLLVAALLCLFLLTLIVAIVYPPNNYDSMIYHVARVMHWSQQGSVAHYPTPILLQLQGAPLAEFFLLHLFLLTGSDALFNLVQWLSLLLVVIAVYSAADLLFPRSGLTAAVLAATLPMGVLQATSTQNDLVAASWLVVSVCLGLCALRNPKITFLLFFTTLALGLAVLTKPTVFLIAAPFAMLCFGLLLSRRASFPALVLSAAVIFLPSMPFYARNLAFFGSPYGPTRGHTNDQVSVAGVTSVVIRNIALHSQVPLPGVAFSAFNAGALGILRMCHKVLGVPVDDPRFSLLKKDAFQPNDCGLRGRGIAYPFHEDCTGNPLHLVLFLTFLPIVLVGVFRRSSGFREARRRLSVRRAGPLMGSAAIGFVALAGVFKWQPWGSRLDLPLFVLACIPLGGLVAGLRRTVRGLLMVGFFSLAFTAVCLNATRPVMPLLQTTPIDRRAAYFANRPDLLKPYLEISRTIKAVGCHQIGYRVGQRAGIDEFEYPFWALLAEGGYWFRFEHVDVVSRPGHDLRDVSFKPCAIIASDPVGGDFSSFRLYLERLAP